MKKQEMLKAVKKEMNLEEKLYEILNSDVQPEHSMPQYKNQNIKRVVEEMSVFIHFLRESINSNKSFHTTSEMIDLVEHANKKITILTSM